MHHIYYYYYYFHIIESQKNDNDNALMYFIIKLNFFTDKFIFEYHRFLFLFF
jgi:hypothetical protein